MVTDKFENGMDYVAKVDGKRAAVILLHGYGANMSDLAPLHSYLDPADEFDWYFPNAARGVDHYGRAWFPIDMMELQQAMMTGAPRSFKDKLPSGLQEAINLLEKAILELENKYDSLILGGFSQGAMVSSHLLASSKKIAAYLAFSGVLLAEDSLKSRMKKLFGLPFFQSHGTNDQILQLQEGENLFHFLKDHKMTGELHKFSGGHEIPMDIIQKAKIFLSDLKPQ